LIHHLILSRAGGFMASPAAPNDSMPVLHSAPPLSVRGPFNWEEEKIAWRAWWRASGAARRFGPLGAVIAFWAAHGGLGGLRGDHGLLGLAVLAFAYAGPRADPWFRLLLPLALMGAVYDGQGYVRRALHGQLTVHVAEPAAFDRAAFGIATVEGVLTPPEWLQLHTHPLLDVFCSFIYLSFVPAFAAMAWWFRWRAGRQPPTEAARQAHEAESLTWAFFWLGLISCVTYYAYPAAPPWYLAHYGPGPVVLDAPPSPAGAARVDELLGITLFADFYGRSPNVFGAIPSLHVAIPLLAAGFAWRIGSLRGLSTAYALVMAFAAVYLNHHYVLDLLWGGAYALLALGLVCYFRRGAGRG
jgi:hypothetical protein